MHVSLYCSAIVGVRVRADRGGTFREQPLAVCIYKGTTVAAADQIRLSDVLVYAA
jgi:hypothetical protein